MMGKTKRPFYETVKRHLIMPESEQDNLRGTDWLMASIQWNKEHSVRYHLWRIYVNFTQPILTGRHYIYWPLRNFWERGRRGWSVQDAWSVGNYLNRIVPEMLTRLKAESRCHPLGLTQEEWSGAEGVLDQIIAGFRAQASLSTLDYLKGVADNYERYTLEKHKPMEEALSAQWEKAGALFVKWYAGLWS